MKKIGCLFFRAFLVGGNSNNSANAGFRYSNVNNSVSNSNANIRAQLSLINKNISYDREQNPCLLAKNDFKKECW